MIRLLLVDDHPVVRTGYQHLLEQDGDMTVVAQAGSVDEGYALFAAHEPDITITDVALPGSSGLDLIHRLRERSAQARTLVFSMHDSEMLVHRAFELGALGFVSKSCAPDSLIEAVRSALAGRALPEPGAAAALAAQRGARARFRAAHAARIRGVSPAVAWRVACRVRPRAAPEPQDHFQPAKPRSRKSWALARAPQWRTWRSATAWSPQATPEPRREFFPVEAACAPLTWAGGALSARAHITTNDPRDPPMPRLPHSLPPPTAIRLAPVAAAALLLCQMPIAQAQAPASAGELPPIEVIEAAPLPGLNLPRDQIPGNVQTGTAAEMDRMHAPDITNFMSRALGSVTVTETQGNPFQPDVNYRGFTASPLLGTPQGLSVFMDGVRLNQPFGDVVSWDLFPRNAISSITLVPGSNPLFGLNTLGGALSIHTKDGINNPGTMVEVLAGQYGRVGAQFETGGHNVDNGMHWYLTANAYHEDGWRPYSPSDLRQLFAKVGHTTRSGDVSLSMALADNDLTGNGAQEAGALQRDWGSVRTIPDETKNKSLFLNLATTQALNDRLSFSGNAYYRDIRTNTFNGDMNDESLDQSVYQPNAAERAALAEAGYSGFPTSGENAGNTPFPKWRCIANILLNAEPGEKCNGLVNETQTRQKNYGLAGQFSFDAVTGSVGHKLVVGAAYDASRVSFNQSAQYGFINPDRSIGPAAGPGAFADGTQDSEEAFDARVDLSSRSHTGSFYLSDTLALGAGTHLTFAGRYNRTSVRNLDAITPGGGPGSLDGDYTFSRFNPAVGLTWAPSESVTVYGGVNQGSRAPTAIELGCADPASPCKLPNSFAGDPPLKQVVTTTFEAGLRGVVAKQVVWNFGVFRSDNKDDLLFVTDDSSGFGYFKNFGKTRRQGIEMGLHVKPAAAWTVGGNLSLLDATYRTAEVVGGTGNSSNSAAAEGFPGTEGSIEIQPGDRIPLLPRQLLKIYADWEPNAYWRIGLDMTAVSGTAVRGNENGQQVPDGLYYSGSGRTGGYAVFNLGVDYKPQPGWKVFLQVTNLFDRKYATAGQLGANGFTTDGSFIARPLPANANGDYPVPQATLYTPGAPRTAWVGLRYNFKGS